MNPVFAVVSAMAAGVLGWLISIKGDGKKKAKEQAKAVQQKSLEGTATSQELRDAAVNASKNGLPATAAALHDKADVQQAIEERENTTLPDVVPSPWSDVPDAEWDKLVMFLMPGKPNGITSSYGLGAFLIDMRQLADYGYAYPSTLKQTNYNGKQVWKADWIPPYNLNDFLNNIRLQYEVFQKIMIDHRKMIESKYHLGKTIITDSNGNGITPTLSGALALMRRLGPSGANNVLSTGNASNLPQDALSLFGVANGLF